LNVTKRKSKNNFSKLNFNDDEQNELEEDVYLLEQSENIELVNLTEEKIISKQKVKSKRRSPLQEPEEKLFEEVLEKAYQNIPSSSQLASPVKPEKNISKQKVKSKRRSPLQEPKEKVFEEEASENADQNIPSSSQLASPLKPEEQSKKRGRKIGKINVYQIPGSFYLGPSNR
jgi:hypothetical protein